MYVRSDTTWTERTVGNVGERERELGEYVRQTVEENLYGGGDSAAGKRVRSCVISYSGRAPAVC